MDQTNEPAEPQPASTPQVPESAPVDEAQRTSEPVQPSISLPAEAPAQITEPGSATEQPLPKKRSKGLVISAIATLLIITVCGIFLATQIFGSNLDLETYQGDGFTIDYPVGYEVMADDTGVVFKELVKEGDDPESASQVYVVYAKIGSLEAQQKQLIAANFEKVGETFVSSISSAGRNVTKNNDEQKTTLLGRDAKLLTGDVYDDEKQAGSYKLVVRLTDTDLVLLGVAAHVSDADVKLAADKIINSFQLE